MVNRIIPRSELENELNELYCDLNDKLRDKKEFENRNLKDELRTTIETKFTNLGHYYEDDTKKLDAVGDYLVSQLDNYINNRKEWNNDQSSTIILPKGPLHFKLRGTLIGLAAGIIAGLIAYFIPNSVNEIDKAASIPLVTTFLGVLSDVTFRQTLYYHKTKNKYDHEVGNILRQAINVYCDS